MIIALCGRSARLDSAVAHLFARIELRCTVENCPVSMTEQAEHRAAGPRIMLPGFVFKGVVIGGGYDHGPGVVEVLLSKRARVGELYGILFAMLVWSTSAQPASPLQAVRATSTEILQDCSAIWFLFENFISACRVDHCVIAAAAGATGATLLGCHLGRTGMLMARLSRCAASAGGVAMSVFSSIRSTTQHCWGLGAARIRDRRRRVWPVPAPKRAGSGDALCQLHCRRVIEAPSWFTRRSRRDESSRGLLLDRWRCFRIEVLCLGHDRFIQRRRRSAAVNVLLEDGDGVITLGSTHGVHRLIETGVGGVHAINTEWATNMSAARLKFTRWDSSAFGSDRVGSGVVAEQVGIIDIIAKGYGAFAYACGRLHPAFLDRNLETGPARPARRAAIKAQRNRRRR